VRCSPYLNLLSILISYFQTYVILYCLSPSFFPTGKWLNVNGDAIYNTVPWNVCQNETSSSVFYTKKDDRLYAIFLRWPFNNSLLLNCVTATESTEVRFLGIDASAPVDRRIPWTPIVSLNESQQRHQRNAAFEESQPSAGVEVMLPLLTPDVIPCQFAWALVITGFAESSTQRSD
jgi:Alpha-L-fucosidase C-terminal domain